MAKSETFGLILTYTDGTREQFRFPAQADQFQVSGLIEKLLGSAVLSLQLDNRLLIIPSANIRSVELFPVPDKLPDVILQNVKRVAPDD